MRGVDGIPIPPIITEYLDEGRNFALRVHAYRHLTREEMGFCLSEWLRSTRRKKIPRNKTVDVLSFLGSESR